MTKLFAIGARQKRYENSGENVCDAIKERYENSDQNVCD